MSRVRLRSGPPAAAAPDPGSPVKVNQVAYVPGLPKQATVVSAATAPVAWTLRNAAGATVASGQTAVKGADALSGDTRRRSRQVPVCPGSMPAP